MGMLTSYNLNASTFCSLGIGVSGVRLVSSAKGEALAEKTASVRRLGLALALISIGVLAITFMPVSRLTYQSARYDLIMLVAGLSIPCVVMTTTWSSLLLAAGEVKGVAGSQIKGAATGLVLGAPLIYLYDELGIALSVLSAAFFLAYFTWREAAIRCPLVPGAKASAEDGRMMVKIGGAYMAGEMFGQVAAYVVRVMILRMHGEDLESGLADAGYYHAAMAITGILPGFVFGAMGTDFFPRVSAARSEDEAYLISEKQIRACLLLGLPGLIGILTCSKVLVSALYAASFAPTEPLVPWFVWATFLNITSWPLALWLTARADPSKLLTLKIAGNAAMPLAAMLLIPAYGLTGAVSAYLFGNLCFALLTIYFVRLRAGRFLCAQTSRWLAISAISILASQYALEYFSGSALRHLPLAIALIVCCTVYLRQVRGESLSAES